MVDASVLQTYCHSLNVYCVISPIGSPSNKFRQSQYVSKNCWDDKNGFFIIYLYLIDRNTLVLRSSDTTVRQQFSRTSSNALCFNTLAFSYYRYFRRKKFGLLHSNFKIPFCLSPSQLLSKATIRASFIAEKGFTFSPNGILAIFRFTYISYIYI